MRDFSSNSRNQLIENVVSHCEDYCAALVVRVNSGKSLEPVILYSKGVKSLGYDEISCKQFLKMLGNDNYYLLVKAVEEFRNYLSNSIQLDGAFLATHLPITLNDGKTYFSRIRVCISSCLEEFPSHELIVVLYVTKGANISTKFIAPKWSFVSCDKSQEISRFVYDHYEKKLAKTMSETALQYMIDRYKVEYAHLICWQYMLSNTIEEIVVKTGQSESYIKNALGRAWTRFCRRLLGFDPIDEIKVGGFKNEFHRYLADLGIWHII